MTLCVNCLAIGAKNVRIGNDFGSQRDPEYHILELCKICEEALMTGNLRVFSQRYTDTREISR